MRILSSPATARGNLYCLSRHHSAAARLCTTRLISPSACVAPATFPFRSFSHEISGPGKYRKPSLLAHLPFHFETGIALYAKHAPRPFPPPFHSPPSGSFSDPLSTHHRSRDRRPSVLNGGLIRGRTNGDDAVFANEYFVAANDGVGAWSQRPRGHAGLWARLLMHFWIMAIEDDAAQQRLSSEGADSYTPNPVKFLEKAYRQTIEATQPPNDWKGTTTACAAQLYYRRTDTQTQDSSHATDAPPMLSPVLYVASLGDSQVMIVRPHSRGLVYKTTEQWHWFDCPRQLGTNSKDTPLLNAQAETVDIQAGDLVLAMSDGVIDNLWPHEIVENVCTSLEQWNKGKAGPALRDGTRGGGMRFVAQELMIAAKTIALDPFAESPYMERAIEEGLASEGGKPDDISVVAALVREGRATIRTDDIFTSSGAC